MRKLSSYVVAATVLLALALCPVAARADSTSFDLSYGVTDQFQNPSNFSAAFPGPWAMVTVTLNSSTQATITFNSSAFGGGTYWLSDGGAAVVNVNASSFTASILSDPLFSNFSSGNFDGSGLGHFNLIINNGGNNQGYNNGVEQTISFTIDNTSGTWSSASDVLAKNNEGEEAASHITVIPDGGGNPYGCSPSKVCQGYAGNNPVPEPPVNALLACSALLFGGLFLRRPLWS